MKKIIVLFLCAAMLWPAPISLAGPQGGKVVGGNAQISQKGSSTTINQTTDRAIINWNSFDINKNESVRHNMPSSNSAGLHRVVGGGGASQIAGSLQSNGNIYLVNPAGVVIHNGAKIDVNGFVATSRDITDQNFMKGNMVFDKPELPDAAIINKGNITLKDNGLAVLVAPTVRNDGVIAGKLGKVALGGSDAAWKLDMTGDDLIAFTLDEKAVNTLHTADGKPLASVENNGQIKAEGGVVVMSAAQLDGFVGSVVNNGEISAASVESKGGKIIFKGQGDKVNLVNNGKLDVSSQSGDGGLVRMSGQAQVVNAGRIEATGTKGGKVVLTGKDITLKSDSVIDASGTNGGGTVLVGGNAKGKGPELNAKIVTVQSDAEILASAKLKGDGGQVVVWSDEKTQFEGKIEAKGGGQGGDGGFVETSAKLLIIGDPAVVNTSSKKGKAGTWLMDPEDLVIAAANGDISGETISKGLEENNIVIEVSGEGEGNGDIIVNDEIKWNSNTTLNLSALNSIILYNNIISTGDSASLIFNTKDSNIEIINSSITITGQDSSLIINDNYYSLIRTYDDLIAVSSTAYGDEIAGRFALAHSIDASDYVNNKGFIPIGSRDNDTWQHTKFTGHFEGLGNSLNNLSLIPNGKSTIIGLFSIIDGKVSNLNILNAKIAADSFVRGGILAWSIFPNGVAKNISVTSHANVNQCSLGGLVDQNTGKILYSNSVLNINSNSNNYSYTDIGGLVNGNGGEIFNSSSFVNINFNSLPRPGSAYEIGGFAYSNFGTIENCYSNGSILSNNDEVEVSGFISNNYGIIKNSYSSIEFQGDMKAYGFAGFIIKYEDNPLSIEACYWNNSANNISDAIGFLAADVSKDEVDLTGLSSSEMRQQSNFKNWDFENIWKIDEGKSFPELRGVVNNNMVVPGEPVNPPPVEPDPVIPDPVDPDPTPVDPDPVNPAPVDPTPTEPDPVQPEPDQPTPSNPDPVTPTDPTPTDPTTPVQPSNPQPNQPAPTQPSPSNPTPSVPVTPSQPVNPTPTQPSPLVPVTPNNPQTPTSSSNSSSNESRPTIHYNKDNGTLYVYKDSLNNGFDNNNTLNSMDNINQNIETSLTGDSDITYTTWANDDELGAWKEKIQQQQAEDARNREEMFKKRVQNSIISQELDDTYKTLSNSIDDLSKFNTDNFTLNFLWMASTFLGKQIYDSVKDFYSNPVKAMMENVKTLVNTLQGKGWDKEFVERAYIQALITKATLADYYLSVASNAKKGYGLAKNRQDKIQFLCTMDMATQIANAIMNDNDDVIYFILTKVGDEAAKEYIKKMIIGDTIKDELKDIQTSLEGSFDKNDVDFANYTIDHYIKKTGLYKPVSTVTNELRDGSVKGMAYRLSHTDAVNNIVNDTMSKYNNLLDSLIPGSTLQYSSDIRTCWDNENFQTRINQIKGMNVSW